MDAEGRKERRKQGRKGRKDREGGKEIPSVPKD